MNCEYIVKSDRSRRLILIFTGWSCDSRLYQGFRFPPGWDVAVAWNYDDLSIRLDLPSQYSTVYLFAWSMGVFAANRTLDSSRITAAYAVNGTLLPVSDKYGIPEAIYQATMDSLSPENLAKFQRRMAGSRATLNALKDRLNPQPDISALVSQLKAIQNTQAIGAGSALPWKRVYIADDDHIFPATNMRASWKNHHPEIEICELEGSHFPDMEMIIRRVLPDTSEIGNRFREAANTYDANAVVQRSIAENLAELIRIVRPCVHGSLLEIGPGTGLLTSMLLPLLRPSVLHLVDIADIPEGAVHKGAVKYIEDAEIWITHPARRYNCIASSATFQWFSNLHLFLKNAAEALEDNGILAFSCFTQGNLSELEDVRPAPLLYHSPEQILAWMKDIYDEVQMLPEEYPIDFDSPSELVAHLKTTGVAGSAGFGASALKLRNIRKLTYRAALFIGRKRMSENI